MTLTELITSQLLDPFRIGLLIALVLTAYNTAGTVAIGIPIVLGAIFVAVLLPTTTQAPPAEFTTLITILTGLAVNGVLIAIILGAKAAWSRISSSR